MNTVQVYLNKKHAVVPYLRNNTTGSRAVRNSANFLIRNTYTALGKSEAERTPNENAVLLKVCMCLEEANRRKTEYHEKQLASGREHTLKLHRFPDEDHKTLSYEQIDAVLKLSEDMAYYSCTSQVNQQAIRKTCGSWKAFFAALKRYKEDPSSFTGRPRIPGYIRTEEATAHFPAQVAVFAVNDADGKGYLRFANSETSLCLGSIPCSGTYVKTEVVPCSDGYKLMITFDDGSVFPEAPESPERIMAIDPGVSNFAACVTNTGSRPFIIDGRYIKSINRSYNRNLARYRSILCKGHDSDDGVVRTSKRILRLSEKRDDRLRDLFYKASHAICRKAESQGVEVIVFGHNKGQKQDPGMGRINNQNFVQIPYLKFYSALRNTASKYGIAVIMQEESYSSRADFKAMDPVPTYGTDEVEPVFSGSRVKRGLYRHADGTVSNADINGAANILRKRYDHAFNGVDTGFVNSVDMVRVKDLYPQFRLQKARYKKIKKVSP